MPREFASSLPPLPPQRPLGLFETLTEVGLRRSLGVCGLIVYGNEIELGSLVRTFVATRLSCLVCHRIFPRANRILESLFFLCKAVRKAVTTINFPLDLVLLRRARPSPHLALAHMEQNPSNLPNDLLWSINDEPRVSLDLAASPN